MKKRKTGQKVGFIVEDKDGRYLYSGFAAAPKWGRVLQKASIWETLKGIRHDVSSVVDDDADGYRVQEVFLSKKGNIKTLVGNSYPLFNVASDDEEESVESMDFEKMLTNMLQKLEEHGLDTDRWPVEKWLREYTPEVASWWKSQKKTIEQYREAARLRALEKLTIEEQQALGITQ